MKKMLILSALFIGSGSAIALNNGNQVKPATTTSTTVANIKLAEAKAILNKANTRTLKSNLGTADGGI